MSGAGWIGRVVCPKTGREVVVSGVSFSGGTPWEHYRLDSCPAPLCGGHERVKVEWMRPHVTAQGEAPGVLLKASDAIDPPDEPERSAASVAHPQETGSVRLGDLWGDL